MAETTAALPDSVAVATGGRHSNDAAIAIDRFSAEAIRVDGVDISTAMVEQLRTKPGGDQLSVTIGDFARSSRTIWSTPPPGRRPTSRSGRDDLGKTRPITTTSAWRVSPSHEGV